MRYLFIFLLVFSAVFSLQTNPNPVVYHLFAGERIQVKDVMFLNDHPSDIHISVSVEGDASRFIKIKDAEMDIPKGEARWVEYEIFIPEGTKTGEYSGYVVATVDGYGGGAAVNLSLKKTVTIIVSGKPEITDFLEFLLSMAVLLLLAYIFLSIVSNVKRPKKPSKAVQ